MSETLGEPTDILRPVGAPPGCRAQLPDDHRSQLEHDRAGLTVTLSMGLAAT
jgi:hypothetical protein